MKRRWVTLSLIISAAIVLWLGYLAAPYFRAAYRSTEHFTPSALDGRVHHERGGEALASVVAGLLPDAIATVEGAHGRKFREPVRVHVCATTQGASDFLPNKGWDAASGWVYAKRLFLAPRLADAPARVRAVTTHELSHLHLEQYLGTIRHKLCVPRWFREGLAVVASSGGGAENASEAECRDLIRRRVHLTPDDAGSLIETPVRKLGLSEHQYYRQSGMFVAYLKAGRAERFDRFMEELLGGASFAAAFKAAYHQTVAQAWEEFARQ